MSSASAQRENMTYDALLLKKRIEDCEDCEFALSCMHCSLYSSEADSILSQFGRMVHVIMHRAHVPQANSTRIGSRLSSSIRSLDFLLILLPHGSLFCGTYFPSSL